jgi:hypothetical protein
MTFAEFQASRRRFDDGKDDLDWEYGSGGQLQIWNWENAPNGGVKYQAVAPNNEFEISADDFDWVERRLYELAWQFGYLDPERPTFH